MFPVWFDGLPAILQGYFQRVFLPGVSVRIDEAGLFHPNLMHLKRMAAVCAYGESQRDVAAKRDPARRFVRDNIGALIDPKGRFEYIALYDMNFTAAPPARGILEAGDARLRGVVSELPTAVEAAQKSSPKRCT